MIGWANYWELIDMKKVSRTLLFLLIGLGITACGDEDTEDTVVTIIDETAELNIQPRAEFTIATPTNTSPYSLISSGNSSTYDVTNFGLDYRVTASSVGQIVCYPTSDNCFEGSNYAPLVNHSAVGDFNGDGFEDAVINWGVSPHTTPRDLSETPSVPSFYLNDGNGGLVKSNNIVTNHSEIIRHMTYRIGVADFNLDGVDDFVTGTMGRITRLPGGGGDTEWEPILLMLSNPDGTLHDATRNIEGQENGGVPKGFSFAHDLSIGDVNGDGDVDLYAGGVLFINNGRGEFKNAKANFSGRRSRGYIMSSVMDDFDNDGMADIVPLHAESSPSGSKSYVYLSDNEANPGLRLPIELPEGLFGHSNTKHNHAASADLNGDGLKDIVIAQTRANPYYQGRSLQILMNKNGQFEDQTTTANSFSPAKRVT